ncbi:hypothetical protein X769_15550 [Mesorhizobium sp. LSJC268A00]|nr:hypothetical protein X769_15550 [Mesorhizobium sp. LSJC268A00]ESZ06302.1 hypothetical protein X735_31275 [Mesorhizobium sp. L2C085B000]
MGLHYIIEMKIFALLIEHRHDAINIYEILLTYRKSTVILWTTARGKAVHFD